MPINESDIIWDTPQGNKTSNLKESDITWDNQKETPKYDLGPVLTGAKQAIRETLTAEAGSLPQRVIKGAIVNPVLGTLQLTGSPGVKELAQEVDTATQKGRAERGSTGFDFAEFFGSLGNPQNFLVALKGATALGTVGRGTGAGAVAGATQPVLDEDFAAEKLKQILFGAGAGGILTGAGIGLSKAKEFLSEAIKPFREAGRDSILFQKLQEIIPADKWEAVKNALNIAATEDKTRTALSLPTATQSAAEATANIPEATGLAAWEKVISKIPGLSGKFNAFRQAGEQARYENIASIGGSKAQLAAAEAEREATAKNLYGVLDETLLPGRERQLQKVRIGETGSVPLNTAEGLPRMVEVGRNPITNEPILQQASSLSGNTLYKTVVSGYKYAPQIASLMERPAIKAAFDDAAVIARNMGVDLFTEAGQLTGQGAHLVKLALDDAATGGATTAIGKNAQKAIIDAKGAYVNWVEKNVPAYKTARETFAAQSGPINRMKVGQQLEAALNTPLDKERAGAFANAVAESARTLKKATGQDRYKTLNEILTPDEVKRVDYVLENLIKKEAARKSGSATTIDATMIGKEGHQLPQFLSATATVANTVLRLVRKDANARITNKFGEMLMNPAELARFMNNIPANDANAVVKALNVVLPPQYRNALAARLSVTATPNVYQQESKPIGPNRGSVFPQNQQQGLFNQPQSKNDLQRLVSATIQQKNVPPELARVIPAVIQTESSWNPKASNKNSSAKGLFQMTNAARADVGIPRNATVQQDIEGGIDYLLKQYRKYGNVRQAIQAYNQGHYNPKSKEGRQYVATVMGNL